jgi:hypothetical protein
MMAGRAGMLTRHAASIIIQDDKLWAEQTGATAAAAFAQLMRRNLGERPVNRAHVCFCGFAGETGCQHMGIVEGAILGAAVGQTRLIGERLGEMLRVEQPAIGRRPWRSEAPFSAVPSLIGPSTSYLHPLANGTFGCGFSAPLPQCNLRQRRKEEDDDDDGDDDGDREDQEAARLRQPGANREPMLRRPEPDASRFLRAGPFHRVRNAAVSACQIAPLP